MTTLPNNNPITNIASMGFQYLVDPTSIPINAAILTNGVGTVINVAYLDLIQSATPSYVKVNDEITYVFTISNLGNTAATEVILMNTIPSGTSLVSNSIFFDNVPINNGSLSHPVGINLGTIPTGSTSTLQFRVTVNTIPTENPIKNSSTIKFKYTVDPSIPNGKSSGNNSNITLTTVNYASIDNSFGGGFIKKASKNYAKVGDIVTYTISLKNTGNTKADEITFIDTIPLGMSFINDSLTYNGVSLPSASPVSPGISLGSIPKGSLCTLTFDVKVDTIPTSNPIINNSSLKYSYTVDPSIPNGTLGGGNSNNESTEIYHAFIDNGYGGGFTKYSSPSYVKIGDTVTYVLKLKNTGNTKASNLVVIDTIPNGTTFINNSVLVNNVTIPGLNPNGPNGITISSLESGEVSTIQFKVTINTIPTLNPIPNSSTIKYKFTVNPSTPNDTTWFGNANNVFNTVNTAIINTTSNDSFVETVNNSYGKVGDILTYTISLKNTGNVMANNIILSSTIADAASLIQDSIMVNNIASSNNTNNGNLSINLASLDVNSISTIQFKVTVNTIPSNNLLKNSSSVAFTFTVDPSTPNDSLGFGNSNIVTTNISQAIIDNKIGGGFIKKSDVDYAKPKDTITYKITLKNTGNVAANNITFIDTIPDNTSLIPGSIILNGITQADTLPAIKINTSSIAPNAISTIQFKVLVDRLPSVNPLLNHSSVNFNFTVDPSLPNSISYGGNSNTSKVQINAAIIDNINGNGLTQSVSSTNVTLDDIVTYTIALKNTGNVAATNVILYNTIPEGTTFVADSVTLNTTSISGANPSSVSGVNIGNINSNTISTVTFKVLVVSVPDINPISNAARVKFNYTVNPANPNAVTDYGHSNITFTKINTAYLDNTNGSIFKESNTPYFLSTKNSIEYTVRLKNTGTTDVFDVTLLGTLPNGTSFIPDSLTLNNTIIPESIPFFPLGANIGTLPSGELSTITFKVKVHTIPSPNLIKHSTILSYKYIIDPSIPRIASKIIESNSSFNKINEAIINNLDGGFTKKANKNNAKVGDTVTYTISTFNIGNVSANNVILKDTIPDGMLFVPDSVYINDSNIPDITPASANGINLGVIPPSTGITIDFQVTVVSVPLTNPIPNTASVMFKYMVDPSVFRSINGYGTSNTVTTKVNQASIDVSTNGFIHTLSSSYLKLNDKVTSTFILKNTGNIPAKAVIFTSTIPVGASVLENSVTLNGEIVSNANVSAPDGIAVGVLNPGDTATITYDMIITSIPPLSEIKPSGSVSFLQRVDPILLQDSVSSGHSNIAKAKVNTAIIDNSIGSFIKKVSSKYVKLGDTLTYTFSLKNTGNVTANNVLLIDTIPTGLTFVKNSLSINGGSKISSSIPLSGIAIGNISPGATSTVQFKALVSTIPTINPLTNTGYTEFSYTLDPSIPNGEKGYGSSDLATSTYKQAIIDNKYPSSFVISTISKFNKLGDELPITIELSNVGNTAAKDVIIKATIPNGTLVVPESLSVNNIPEVETITNNVLIINIGTLGLYTTKTINFKLLINSLPITNPIPLSALASFGYTQDPSLPNLQATGTSNTITVKVNTAIIDDTSFVKSVSHAYGDVEYTLTYNLLLQNKGNTAATNVVILSTLPNDTSFVENSVLINGIPSSSSGLNHPVGLNIGTIPSGNSTLVSFAVKVDTIPKINPIINSSTVLFDFVVDPSLAITASSSGNSNSVATKINRAIIDYRNGLSQRIDKDFCSVGELLTYTVTLRNTGTTEATNIILRETFPKGISFVKGSVTVNGVTISDANPTTNSGINIGSLSAGGAVTAIFKVIVNEIPSDYLIQTSAKVNFKYKVDPTSTTSIDATGESNITLCTVNSAIINNDNGIFKQAITPSYSIVGGIITYSFNIANTGNVNAYNVRLIDTLPDGLEFIPNSVEVNGISLPGVAPNSLTGISLNTIAVNSALSVFFKVKVNKIPVSNPINDNSIVTFDYISNPELPMISGEGISSSGTLNIKEAKIDYENGGGFHNNVNYNYSTIGEILTYDMKLNNTGNTSANNILLTCTLPEGLSFVDDSVFINGFNILSSNPSPGGGININVIPPMQEVLVSFSALVTTVPEINPVEVSGTIEFTYTADPSEPNGILSGGNSNTVNTQILLARIDNFDITPSVNYADLNNKITYTIELLNTGNAFAYNIKLTSTIPLGTTFIENSVYVDGVNKPNLSPNSEEGILIEKIDKGASSIVNFDVLINSIPSPNPIPISATVNFDFTLDPNIPTIQQSSGNSIIAYTQVNTAIINGTIKGSFEKVSNPKFTKVNKNIVYSLVLKNIGNQSANNVVIIDTLPNALKFTNGSIVVNGRSYPTAKIAPPAGLPIGTINPNQAVTVTFNTTITTIPTPNPLPNSAFVKFVYTVDPEAPTPIIGRGNSTTSLLSVKEAVIDVNRGFVKKVDKEFLALNDIASYTLSLKNTGNADANNVTLTDDIPNGLDLVPNSFKLNGTVIPNVNLSSDVGVNIGTISAGATTTVLFNAVVNSIPNPNTVDNFAKVKFTYTVDPAFPNSEVMEGTSNTVSSTVNSVNFGAANGGIVLSSDKESARINDEITLTTVISNLGNITAHSVVLTSSIPTGAIFVPYSVSVDGFIDVTLNPSTGIDLGNIDPNTVITVSYKIQCVSIIENNGNLFTQSIIDYEYYLNSSSEAPIKARNTSNALNIPVSSADISNLTGGFELTSDKEVVLVGDTLTYSITLANKGNLAAYDVSLYSTIPESASLIEGSIYINDVPYNGTPENGILVGEIPPAGSAIISFSLNIKDLPPDGILNSDGIVTYSFNDFVEPPIQSSNITPSSMLEPNSFKPFATTVFTKSISNLLKTRVVSLKFTSSHTSNIKYVDMGDELYYSIFLQNDCNVNIENVIIQDSIPSGTVFIPNSLAINGVTLPGINPTLPYNIGSLAMGSGLTLSLKVSIVSLPDSNPIFNILNIKFNYSAKPVEIAPNMLEAKAFSSDTLSPITLLGTSTKTYLSEGTSVNTAYIGGEKFKLSADKEYVTDGDKVTYTLHVSNIGTVDAQNILINVNIPKGMKFVLGSVKINNIGYPDVDPEVGISLGSLNPFTDNIITYEVTVLSNLNTEVLAKQCNVKYCYSVAPTDNVVEDASSSNIHSILYRRASLVVNKKVDKTRANLKEPLLYTVTIQNTGNIDASTVIIKDYIDSSLSFIPGSVTINNTPFTSMDITDKILLSKIPANSEVVITFKCLLTSPAPGYLIGLSSYTTIAYEYIVNPNTAAVSDYIEIKTPASLALVYLNRNKKIPCNPLCKNTIPCDINCRNVPLCCCGILKSRVYSVENLASAAESLSTGSDIEKYKMWVQNTVNHTIPLNDMRISKIQSISAKLEYIRTSLIDTSLQLKNPPGKIQSVDAIITFTINYLNNRGHKLTKKGYKLFSNRISVGSAFANTPLKIKGIIEDLSITDFSNNSILLSATSLIYLTTESASSLCLLPKLNCITSNLDNITLCQDKPNFLSNPNILFNSINVYDSTMIYFKESAVIHSTDAKIDILSTNKLINAKNSSSSNNEGKIASKKVLLVSMLLHVTVNFTTNVGTQYVKIPCSAYINLNEDDLPSNKYDVTTCIENLYVATVGTNLYTSANITIKALKLPL